MDLHDSLAGLILEYNLRFESCVNPEGIQTTYRDKKTETQFESCVNPEGIQTRNGRKQEQHCLRAV